MPLGVAAVLGYVSARIILSIVFFGFMRPMELVRRLLGGDPRSLQADQKRF
jgi:hypothetical protein